MEFGLSLLLGIESIDVFDFYNWRNVFNDFYNFA